MDREQLAECFEEDRSRLHGIAYRLLGSSTEADDAVQEAWLRLTRTDAGEVVNLHGWLTTVVARISLDMLRTRSSRREEPLGIEGETVEHPVDPEREAVLAESIGLAMLAVLDRLAPAERVAFVLHDVFGVSFDDIAEIVDRTPAATRQLASRGRRRVQGLSEDEAVADVARQKRVVDAFFQASRAGNLSALLEVLDPDVVLRPDAMALQMGANNGWIRGDLYGAEAVAAQFNGQALAAEVALIDGIPGGAWAPRGVTRVVFLFTVMDDVVVGIDLIADPEQIAGYSIQLAG